jgi:ribulose-phosphate 3-epimerase
MPRIVPAVLTEDPGALAKMLEQAAGFTDHVQVDIMDGKFVPSRSITADDLSSLKIKVGWEAHLMVQSPENYLKAYRNAGAGQVLFHFEAAKSPDAVIEAGRKLGLHMGLVLNPETPASVVPPLADRLDSVLVMSVNPGFYGAKFIPEMLDKARELRRLLPKMHLSIDGGIKESNLLQAAATGVNDICVGSAVFLQPDPGEAFRKLSRMVREIEK